MLNKQVKEFDTIWGFDTNRGMDFAFRYFINT